MRTVQFFYRIALRLRIFVCIRVFMFFLFFFSLQSVSAQTSQDSVINKDSIPITVQPSITDTSVKPLLPKKHVVHIKKDSLTINAADSVHRNNNLNNSAGIDMHTPIDAISLKSEHAYTRNKDFSFKEILSDNPYFNFFGKPISESMDIHKAISYDGIFYLLLGILFYFAFVKLLFGKYLANLLTLFFRVSMRQQQIREQVIQSPLPSLLLNILFVISGGLYAAFLAQFYHLATKDSFWVLFIDFSILLCIIYLVKFLLLKSSGWVFNIQRAADTYIFIVFLTNKIIGVFLLPFLIVLSFSGSLVDEIAVTLSLIIVSVFFIYRFIASFAPLRKEIKMNGFHFFLYLCAFEIVPLLLIYKVLLTYLEKAY